MEKLGQEPAFPEILLDTYSGKPCGQEHGVSKRFYAACAAMQGVLSANCVEIEKGTLNYSLIAEISYRMADELLIQEEKQ